MTKNPVDDYIIAAVPATCIELLWDRCVPHINRVIERAHGEITLEGLKKRLIAGNTLLVTVSKGADIIAVNTLEVRTFDSGKKALFIPVVGGSDVDTWIDRFLVIAKAIAKDHGCEELRGMAVRPGWMKKLEPYGWYNIHMVVGCKVED